MVPLAAFLMWTAMQWAFGWTVYAHGTAYEWVRLYSYALVFLLTAQLARHQPTARRLQRTIIYTGLAVGFFGLLQFLTWNGYLYWVYDPPFAGTRFGPFNNRNYFAGYMVVVLAPAFGLLLAGERDRNRTVIAYLTWIAALTTLISLSRGGALALLASLALVIALRPMPSRRARLRSWAVLAMVVLLAFVVGLAWLQQTDRVVARLETLLNFQQENSFQGRSEIWAGTIEMIGERPLRGWGLNTFGWVFSRYRQQVTSDVAMHAHNEYLETVAETGLIGGAICLWFLVSLLTTGWKRVRQARRKSSWEYGLRLGALAAWSGTLVYALTDFPTIIPAIDYVLVILAALLIVRVDDPTKLSI